MRSRPVALRPPAVAGTFYPAEPDELRRTLQRAFAQAVRPKPGTTSPLALVVPHAGYPYSAPVAASAYLRLEASRQIIRRVVLLGPSHHVPLHGLAMSSAEGWTTPLGVVPLDMNAASVVRGLPQVVVDDTAHAFEHSLEVQVPFLQTVLDDFELLPMVVGDATTDEVAPVIDALWSTPETLVVVSSDLSHFHSHADAMRLDARTAASITALREAQIDDKDACGARPLRGLLRVVHERGLAVECLDLRNSGDTSGDMGRVVGYGAFAVS